MTTSTPRPTLIVYRRPGCHLCDDAESLLRDELAQRARAGLPPLSVEHVDVSTDVDLEARYGARIPVFAIGDQEAELVASSRQIRELLERAMPKLV